MNYELPLNDEEFIRLSVDIRLTWAELEGLTDETRLTLLNVHLQELFSPHPAPVFKLELKEDYTLNFSCPDSSEFLAHKRYYRVRETVTSGGVSVTGVPGFCNHLKHWQVLIPGDVEAKLLSRISKAQDEKIVEIPFEQEMVGD